MFIPFECYNIVACVVTHLIKSIVTVGKDSQINGELPADDYFFSVELAEYRRKQRSLPFVLNCNLCDSPDDYD
jgi:hypothetical protein